MKYDVPVPERADWLSIASWSRKHALPVSKIPQHIEMERVIISIPLPEVDFETPSAMDWMADAACAGVFDARAIKALCPSCPVWERCLAYGRATKATGPYGGRYLVNGKDRAASPRKRTDLW